MRPDKELPVSSEFKSVDEYIKSLLSFAATSDLFKTLCGGVHVLDAFTSNPPLYSIVVPESWRLFFRAHPIQDILNLLMREQDLDALKDDRNGQSPPVSLLEYIQTIRRLSLCRDFVPIDQGNKQTAPTREVLRGMKLKKAHEVDHFSRFVSDLTAAIADTRPITHLVDLGSGQGYLPRCLASPPYHKHVIAVESKSTNIQGAKTWDSKASLAHNADKGQVMKISRNEKSNIVQEDTKKTKSAFTHPGLPTGNTEMVPVLLSEPDQTTGSIQHVEYWVADGDLSKVVRQVSLPTETQDPDEHVKVNMMVMSLHSCGNLVHHGIRSLLMNPSVSAVALVGCCYNLMTERLGPPTYKLPSLRTLDHPYLVSTSNAGDPHGFPMSARCCTLPTPAGQGLRLNITARMMAVHAPQNWGPKDSESFFTRHFFRALLQRILLDKGLVAPLVPIDAPDDTGSTSSPRGFSGGSEPVLIGSLGKKCYAGFESYVRGAAAKLALNDQSPTGRGRGISAVLDALTTEQIGAYESAYAERKLELSVLWSLMAFSACVVEALIVADRYLFLKEQDEVGEAWVQTVFDYRLSPRNLVVVGIKR